jgi:hypothetical protein
VFRSVSELSLTGSVFKFLVSFFVAKEDNSDGTGLAADSEAAGEEAYGTLPAVAAVGTRGSELPQEDTFLSDPNVRFY